MAAATLQRCAAAPHCRAPCRCFAPPAPRAPRRRAAALRVLAIGARRRSQRRSQRHASRLTAARARPTGFGVDAPLPGRSVEKRAEGLLRAASSLLVYQSALAGEPAQAFLKARVRQQH